VADSNALVSILLKVRDEASSELSRLAAQLGNLPSSVARIAAAAGPIGLIAAASVTAGSAVVALAEKFSDQALALERVARGTGATIEEVQVLEQAYRHFGLATEQSTTALQFMSKAISQHHLELVRLGIDSRDPFQAILQLSDATRKHGDAAQVNAELSRLLGREWRSLAGVVGDLREATERSRQSLAESDALIGEPQVQKARELKDATEKLGTAWRAVWIDMGTVAIPPATAILKILDAMIRTARGVVPEIKKLVDAVRELPNIWASISANPFGFAGGGWRPPPGAAPGPAGPGADAFFGDEGGQETPREKQVKRLMELLGKGRVVAEDFANMLDRIKAAKEAEGIWQSLGVPSDKDVMEQWQSFQRRGGAMAPGARLAPDAAVARIATANVRGTAQGAFAIVLEEWGKTVEKMSTIGAVLDDAFAGVFQGLQSSVQSAFRGLIAGGQSMAAAFKNIIGGIGVSMLDMMSRVVASGLFALFMKLVFLLVGFAINPVAGTVAAMQAAPDWSPVPLVPRRAGLPGAARAGGGGGVNIVLQSFVALDAFQQLTSPGAPLREALQMAHAASSFD
jgi:hypothetical protein